MQSVSSKTGKPTLAMLPRLSTFTKALTGRFDGNALLSYGCRTAVFYKKALFQRFRLVMVMFVLKIQISFCKDLD